MVKLTLKIERIGAAAVPTHGSPRSFVLQMAGVGDEVVVVEHA